MTPKISLALGFPEHHEQLHRNPSILARGEDYLDVDEDDWDEHVKPRRRSSSAEAIFNSFFTSLSSSLNGACYVLTTGAKKLYSRDSPHRGGQLRNSMVEIHSSQAERSRANSMPAPYRSSESDLDLFGGVGDELGPEDPADVCLSKIEAPSPGLTTLARLLPTRLWTQASK